MRKLRQLLPHITATAAPSALALAIISAMVLVAALMGEAGGPGGPLPGPPPVKSLKDAKDGDRVLVDGKVYTKKATEKFRFELTHDGVTRHAIGRAMQPYIVYPPPPYAGGQHYWTEGEAYVLHRQELQANPPVQFDYYRAGFEVHSWRGDWDTIWGDEETPAPNWFMNYFNLVKHPVGSPATTNLHRPAEVKSAGSVSQPKNYSCADVGPEVMVPYDPNVIVRTNLWNRPRAFAWSTRYGTYSAITPSAPLRLMTSRELIAGGDDTSTPAQFSEQWTGSMPTPNLVYSYSLCAPETIQ